MLGRCVGSLCSGEDRVDDDFVRRGVASTAWSQILCVKTRYEKDVLEISRPWNYIVPKQCFC